ncbi:MAG: superoxide dismutase [Rickettsiales bacterium]|jgi:Fe-Mn family superoxide dismutase|nr:superoxide dismutase [Rickettsiales bacterium]
MFALSDFPLNFARDALEPFMSAQTIDFHYGKHLDGYIKNLNGLVASTDYENLPLADIIKKSAADSAAVKIFNNAAQVFNHNFFFSQLARDNGSAIPALISDSFLDFKKDFADAAMSVFGSGWAWLVDDGGKLKIETTANADTPLAHGKKPLLTLDVWEHSYYLDYQNRRADFVAGVLDHLINWDCVESRAGDSC